MFYIEHILIGQLVFINNNKIKNFKRIARSGEILDQRKFVHVTAHKSRRYRSSASAYCLIDWDS